MNGVTFRKPRKKGMEVSGAAFCSAEAISSFRGSSEMCRASLEMVSVVVDAKMQASKTLEGLTTLERPCCLLG